MQPALFLDRDGVINIDRDYVYAVDDFVWQPGIFDLARAAIRAGLAIVVVTNQSGIGRGYYTETDFQVVTAHMRERFETEGAGLAAVYHCPYHPEAVVPELRHPDHPWRKPRPGMILAARYALGLDLARSILIGDRISDIEAGKAAGVGSLALIAGPDAVADKTVLRFQTVADAARWMGARASFTQKR
jgi:D-glycero-D-manno-heptose 1,7-bisphosphate phosphatase